VLRRLEASQLIDGVRGAPHLVASLLYGSGLRLLEALQVRVKDLDLARRELTVRAERARRTR
jgi:integrase